MISEKLAAFYNKAEDKYFDLLDFLDSKGLPVYTYSDFFENKGIPSFVVTISIILVMLIVLGIVLTYQGPDAGQLTLSLKDADGKALSGVSVIIKDKQGIELYKGTTSDGQKINLSRALYNSDKIYITAQKNGYQNASIEFTIGENNNSPRIRFSKEFESIEARVRLVDKETKTLISGAVIILNSNDLSYELVEDANSFYKKTGIPLGEELLMKINAQGYNEYSQRVSFVSEQVKEIQLEPSTQAYIGKAAVGFNVKGVDEKLINDVKVTVYNKQNDTIEVSDYTRNGSIVASITAGVPLRIVAEKQGYLTYDSDRINEGITIREKEKQVNITLEQGGQKLHVSVNDVQSGLSLEGALVRIFYNDLSLFDEKYTEVTGVEFNGIDPSDTVYITAFVEGYLPRTEKVSVSSVEEVKILLTKVSASNSARLDIYSIDSKANPINGVNVVVNEIVDGNVTPSGLPLIQTSFAGYASAIVSVEKTFQVIGFNDSFEANTVVELQENEFDKKVYLNMSKKVNVVEMKFFDVIGKEVVGTVVVDALDGTNLYDEEIYSGTIYFNGDQRETVEVSVTLEDGNTFTENVIIKGKDYVEVIVYNKDADSLTPVIEFVGLENENGESVFGVTPGAFYWAKFSVSYPRAATKGGIHFRAGSDNTPLVESERIGVYDLSMQGAIINYSTSFTQSPSPGNEAVDRANSGSQGEKNKWVEGVIVQPKGTYTVKVKIRAEDYTAGKVQLKYRAWVLVGEEYYRNPIDDMIGTKSYSQEKSGLYATTLVKDLVMYETLPKCTDSLCITTSFVDEQENLLDSEKFEALRGKIYAMEVEVTSREQDNVKLEVYSDNNINFDSTQTGSLYFARETEFTGSVKKSASISLSIPSEGSQKSRFYFTADEIGAAKINLTATGASLVEKEINFKVVDEKTLLVELSEDQVIVGKNFTVKVTDSGLVGMTNALVKIVDGEGKTTKTIIGDNSDGKGKNGYYRIQNNLSVGLYTVEVTAPSYATNTNPLLVTTRNVFSFPSELEVKLPQGQKYTTIDATLVNNSDFVIQNLAFSVDGLSEEEIEIDYETGEEILSATFGVVAELPLAMTKNQKQTIPIRVTFNGEDNDSADETITLTISGLVEGQFLANVSTTIHAIYNRKLDPSCLKIDESNSTINLIGNEGANDSIAIEVTNNCDQAITLKKTIRAKTKLSAIQLDAEDYLDLQPGEIKELTIKAYNWVERVRDESYSFELIYDSNYLKKSINLNVRLINPTLALSYPAQVTLYLAQGAIKDKATAAQPLYITNISAVPIENISFSQGTTYSASGVKLEIQPVGSINLDRGQSITPARVIFATANSTITEPVESTIEIKGRFGNLNNRAAQYDRYQYYDLYNSGAYSLDSYTPNTSTMSSYTNTNKVLGVIRVTSMYSGYNCLKASLADSLGDPYMFPSSGVQIGKMITVTNTCAEPVMISGATPADYKPNTNTYGMVTPIASSIMMFLPQLLVQPGAAVKLPLSITTTSPTVKREKYEIVVNGVTQLSQTLISSKPFSVKLYSGITLNEEKSKSTTVKLRECVAPNSKEEPREVELVAPLTTDSTNCAERYCDAQNAAKYLSQKILQVVQKARSAGYSQKNTTSDGFPCQLEGACTFAEIGMDEEELFDLYLQNDSISISMLNKELNNLSDGGNDTPFREGTYLSSGFLVEPTLVDIGYIKQRALSGYGKTVFFDTSFSGCGYYQVSISGAFKSGVDGLDTMTPVLIVRARPINGVSKIVTKECQNQITNITNFNPIDSGLSPGKEYGSWLSTINSETKFNDLAKSISKNRFKTEDRVTSSSNGNTIIINQGALTNALAQVCVNGNDKKNIIVTIDSSIATTIDPKQKDAFSQLIIKLVSDTLGGKFGDNCVIKTGDVYSCINLSELGGLGDRKIVLDTEELLFSSSNGGCVNATLYSTINEQLTFSAIPLMDPQPFYGVREISISTDDTLKRPMNQILGQTTSTINPPINTQNTTQNNPTTTQNTTPLQNTTNTQKTTNPTTQNDSTSNTTQNKLESEESIEKIFFADEKPTTQNKINSTTIVNSGVVYTMKFNGGGISNQTTINNPMQLIPNPSSQQYKYYRNIKICATPTDKDVLGKDTQVEYTKANGVKFEIAVRNSMSNETTEDAKQLITINTGTLHPDDLAKFICNTMSGGEDYKYYFTTGWMDTLNEDVPELGAYLEGLKRKGVIDNCKIWTSESGFSGTSAYDLPASEAIGSSLIAYGTSCAATSALCNGFTSGSTVIGAMLGTVFDCGIPMITTYRAEMSQSNGAIKMVNDWFNSLGELTKNWPLIGGTLKTLLSIKEDVPDIEARPGLLYQTGENIADALLTRLTIEGWSKMTSPWAISAQHNWSSKVMNYSNAVGSKGISIDTLDLAKTPLAIRNFSTEASSMLAQPYEDTLKTLLGVTDLTGNKDALKLISDLKKTINDDVAKSISASADELYSKGGKVLNYSTNRIGAIPADSYTEAVRKALENVDSKFLDVASKTDSITGQTTLQKVLGLTSPDPTRAMSIEEVISQLQLNPRTKDLGDGLSLKLIKPVQVTQAVKKAALSICIQKPFDMTNCTKQLEVVFKGDKTKAADVAKIYEGKVNGWTKNQLKTAQKNIAGGTSVDDLTKLIDDAIVPTASADDALKQLTEMTNSKAKSALKKNTDDLIKSAKVSGITNRVTSLGKSMTLGIGCSYLSDYAGRKAFEKVSESKEKEVKKDSKKALNLNTILEKNKTYALSITQKSGEWVHSIVEVTDFSEMNKTISEKKGEIISTKKLIDNKILLTNEKLPEERKLSYWKIKTSISVAKKALPLMNYPFEETETNHQLEILNDEGIRNLIFEYTNNSSKYKISGAHEHEVIAIMLYFWGGRGKEGIYSQIEQEKKTRNGLLKEYVEKLLKVHTNHDIEKEGITLNSKELIKEFGEDKLNKEEAGKLIKMLSFWKIVETRSPNVAIPTSNTGVIAKNPRSDSLISEEPTQAS